MAPGARLFLSGTPPWRHGDTWYPSSSDVASSSATWQTLQLSLFNSLGKPKNSPRLCQPTHQPTPEGAPIHYYWGLTSVYPGKLGPSSVMKMGRSRDSERSQGSGFHKWWKAIPKIKPNRPRMGAHPRQRTTFYMYAVEGERLPSE